MSLKQKAWDKSALYKSWPLFVSSNIHFVSFITNQHKMTQKYLPPCLYVLQPYALTHIHTHILIFHFHAFILSLNLSNSLTSLYILSSFPSSSSSSFSTSITKPSPLNPSKTTSFGLWRQDLHTTNSISSRTQELSPSSFKTATIIHQGGVFIFFFFSC